jgi:RimJ/RimL family protein N-acetyltransferase
MARPASNRDFEVSERSSPPEATLEKGFLCLGLRRIYLIVRKNNHRAQRLYEHLGFRYCGECQKEIQGRMVELFEMALEKENFEGRNEA